MSASSYQIPLETVTDDTKPWVVIPSGDLMLVVGNTKIKILVDTSFMGHISPVFKAMLKPGMGEGNAVQVATGTAPVEIALPEDSPEAVLYGLRAQYGNDPSTIVISPRTIRDVAVFADKYDLVQRFKAVSCLWLAAAPETMDMVDRRAGWDMLTASYYFDNENAFYLMSKFFIEAHVSLLEYALETPDENLGLRLALAIEQVRFANTQGVNTQVDTCGEEDVR
ncbi:hypothetical protein FGRMN_4668 [Fusarium graminum]|nr:hypothetical protein FGRMN_4668 [Fusarium graminum]